MVCTKVYKANKQTLRLNISVIKLRPKLSHKLNVNFKNALIASI